MMVAGTFSKLLAPGLDDVFNTAFREMPEQWTQLFNMRNSRKAYERHFSWAGFEQFQEFGELETIQLRDAAPGYETKFVHRKFGLGYQLSRELVDDNLYSNVLDDFPAQLARSARASKETVAATIFNLAFSGSYPGADGQALVSTAHPLAGRAGGTGSNGFASTTPLSHTALKDALISLRRTTADDGIFSPFTPPFTLVVPDALGFQAQEILNTSQVPYSNDNTTNVLNGAGIKVLTWSYLTSTTDWFLVAPTAQTRLYYFERWPLQQMAKDIDENLSMVHSAFERYSFGFSDWRGIFGAQG